MSQGTTLRIVEMTRHFVYDADRAECISVVCDQRRAGVESDVRRTENVRVLREPLVGKRVWDFENVTIEDRVRAEGLFARYRIVLHTDAGLHPLDVFVDERDVCDRRVADLRRERN